MRHNMSRRRRIGTVCIAAGIILLLAALGLLIYNRWDSERAGREVAEVQDALKEAEEERTPSYDGELQPDVPEDGIMPTITIDGNEYIGTLSVPRFGLELPVMNEWSYPGLKIAPGRYVGSVWTNDLVICGHNYERHFGNLRYLEVGDPITFTDVLGNVFDYTVEEVLILQPTAVDEMITGDWDLTLFTCTIGGRTRVTVRCTRTESE